jgi:pilus assembly protein CpaE
VVGGAAGQEESVNGVLARFGFAPAHYTVTVEQAAARLRDEHFDLVIIPLAGTDPVDLATLEREVRRAGSTALIGTAPHAEPELILRAMRSGVQEFVLHPPDPKELSAAVDRLLRRGRTEGARGGTTIAVYSAKGGLGTTTVAVNLAFGFARNNPEGRVVVADFVVSGGDVGVMLDLKPAYDIGDLVAKVQRIDADLLYSLLTPGSPGVWVLPSGDRPEAMEAVDGGAATAIVQQLRQHFAFTVIDCEHHLSDRTLAALDAADRVLLVTQLSVPALRSAQRTLAVFDRLGYGEEKVSVVVNRHESAGMITVEDAAKLLERPAFARLPNDYRAASSAIDTGKPVVEQAPTSALGRAFVGMSAKLGGVAVGVSQNGVGRATGRLGQLLGFGRK